MPSTDPSGRTMGLGHVDGDKSRYAGPEHRRCNRATAANAARRRANSAGRRANAPNTAMMPSPVARHHGRRTVQQFGHDLAQPLRPDRGGDVHRVHHIGEQHRHLLVLRRSADLCDRCTTLITELGVQWQPCATRPARQSCCGHCTAISSTPSSFHRWSTMSVISPCHLRGVTPATARTHHGHGRLRGSGGELILARPGGPGRP